MTTTKNYRKTVTFNCTPEDLFDVFMNSRDHAAVTGSTAHVTRKPGTHFVAYAGWIEGYTLDCKPGKEIVQAWRGKDWAKGDWSLCTFRFTKMTGGRCKMVFTQVGIPQAKYKKVANGWTSFYWNKIRDWCDESHETPVRWRRAA